MSDQYDDIAYWDLDARQRVHYLNRLSRYYSRRALWHAEQAEKLARLSQIAQAVSILMLGIAAVVLWASI